MRPLEIYAFVQGFKDRSQACRVESATKQESVRSRPGLSREAARTLGLIRALAKKSWRGKKTKPDPDLLLNVPPGFPQDLLADVPDNVITCIGDIKKED